ncbi:GNAT family N-acetyltransferase [Massilia sp. PWRC2]|uniref:GNAT family N-acetyltransferase n=1 Tax=Massilia sp. PWRC2 TaxID=2804626 RepID=UPI003CEDE0E6
MSGGVITVRPTVATDWPALRQLRLAALLESPHAFGVSHAEALASSDDAWLVRAAGSGAATFFMVFDDDQAVGMAAAVATSPGRLGLIAMWVSPHRRGAGADGGRMADQLIAAIKAHSLKQGALELTLEVAPDNHRAVALYARHGFRFVPHVEPLASQPQIFVQRMAWTAG